MKLKYLLLLFVATACFILSSGINSKASAVDVLSPACSSSGSTKDSDVCKSSSANQGANEKSNVALDTIRTATNIVALVAGAVAVIMIIISGFTIVTAGGSPVGQRSGDPNAIKSAQARILNSAIGLLIIAFAWTIIRFVTDKLLS